MKKIILAWPDDERIAEFENALAASGAEILRCGSGVGALEAVEEYQDIMLAVIAEKLADMTGLELVGKILAVNAMIGCAVASRLSAEDFHEESEGLGILMRLPLHPGVQDAAELLAHLKRIGLIARKNQVDVA
ncbi:MAG TPA: response regulator [Desulfobacterales bacterium]|nr:response regulator [Desulfobacterales bacterium]